MPSILQLELIITELKNATFVVSGRAGKDSIRSMPFHIPFDLTKLPEDRQNVNDWVTAMSAVLPPEAIPSQVQSDEAGMRLGSALFECLITGSIRERYDSLLDHLSDDRSWVRIILDLPPALCGIPWELLYDHRLDRRRWLVTDKRISLVRRPQWSRHPVTKQPRSAPLQVAALFANPYHPDGKVPVLSIEAEYRALSDTLQTAVADKPVALHPIQDRDSLGQLDKVFKEQQAIHILHVLCHAEVNKNSHEGILYLTDNEGGPFEVSGSKLRDIIQVQRSHLRLVVLHACNGAIASGDTTLRSIAYELLREDVPALIAMQFAISQDYTADLATAFYRHLMLDKAYAIEPAMTEARIRLRVEHGLRLDWASPVLFLNEDVSLAPADAGATGAPVGTEDETLPTQPPSVDLSTQDQAVTMTKAATRVRVWRERGLACGRMTNAGHLMELLAEHDYEHTLRLLDQLLIVADQEPLALIAASIVEDADIPLKIRLQAARLLSATDPRPGVYTLEPAWCEMIAAGSYKIGGLKFYQTNEPYPARDVKLESPFQIARYPVSIWQLQQFRERRSSSDGWTPLRWRHWKPREHQASGEPRGDDNRPAVGMTWYEAMNFCHWLTWVAHKQQWITTQECIRLPTEAEWEVASKLPASPEGLFGNSAVANVGLSPVGAFPEGESQCGALDMHGNIWEWCASEEFNYPSRAAILLRDAVPTEFDRVPVSRGGSFKLRVIGEHIVYRRRQQPDSQKLDLGFRVVKTLCPHPSMLDTF